MASASKTPNLNLPQWVGTEKPERTDFNAAFDAIDTTVASHMAEDVTQGNPHGIDYKADKKWGALYTASLKNNWTGTLYCERHPIGLAVARGYIIPGTRTVNTEIATLPYKPRTAGFKFLVTPDIGTVLTTLHIDTSGKITVQTENMPNVAISIHILYLASDIT